MKKIVLSALLLCLIAAVPILLPSQDKGTFSLTLAPGAQIPLADSRSRFETMGAALSLQGAYVLPASSFVYLHGSLDYGYLPTVAGDGLNTVGLAAGAGLNLRLLPKTGARLYAAGGYFAGLFRDTGGGNPYLRAGMDISYLLTPSFSLGAGAAYSHYFSSSEPLLQAVSVAVGGGLKIGSRAGRPNLRFEQSDLAPVFPVFHSYYDDHPLGSALIRNSESGPIQDVQVSFYAARFMTAPKLCLEADRLAEGESLEVPLYALFTEDVLLITEATKTQAEIIVEYTYLDRAMTARSSETLRLYDRNAMTWDDDRKAASFVTPKDPAVLRVSKSVAGIVGESESRVINDNFRIGAALMESLDAYGIRYVIDPQTPYVEYSADETALDFLQFPRQTLEYRAGDCDDLSILYAALLESVGIESAFITIPGHIYAAFALDTPPETARKLFLEGDELIFLGDRSWVPVEITMIREGFLEAWRTGAGEWRENAAAGAAALIPVRDAWKLFEPVGILGGEAELPTVAAVEIRGRYEPMIASFTEREIRPRVERLEEEIRRSNENPRYRNRLAVLYARFGLSDKAEAELRKIIAAREYPPALVNLANLFYARRDFDQALVYLTRAQQAGASGAGLLLALARVHYELENFGSARRHYEELAELDPALAARYAYLSSREQGAARAAAFSEREAIEWVEE
jgi:hypothetical protein